MKIKHFLYCILSAPNIINLTIKAGILLFKKNKHHDAHEILTISSGLEGGGAERIAFQILETLKENKRLALLGHNESKNERYVDTHTLKPKVSKWLKKLQAKTGLLDFFHINPVFFLSDDRFGNIAIIHLHNIHADYFSPLSLIWLSKGRHLIWTLHDMFAFTGHCSHSLDCERWRSGCGSCPYLHAYPPVQRDLTAFLLRIKKMSYKNCNMTIVCPSHWIMEKARQSILKDKKFALIPNGVDVDIFYPQDKKSIRNKLGLPENGVFFLFVANKGKSNPWKGGGFYEELALSFTDTPNVYFISIGNSEIKIERNTISLPFVKDQKLLASYYNVADALVYPSLADTFPLTVIESLACGVPVIAFATGGIPEILRHEENGYLASAGEVKELKSGVDWVLKNRHEKKLIEKTCRDTVLKEYTLTKMIERYHSLYRTMGWPY